MLIDPLEKGKELRLYRYQPVLFHSSGILEIQARLGLSQNNMTSKILHGVVESRLEALTFQGVSGALARPTSDMTHEVAAALDQMIEATTGINLETLCRT